MQLGVRIGKLERVTGSTGSCPVCGGEGLCRSVMEINGVELVPFEPVGCPRCGLDRVLKRTIIDLPGDEREQERRVMITLGRCRDPEAMIAACGAAKRPMNGYTP